MPTTEEPEHHRRDGQHDAEDPPELGVLAAGLAGIALGEGATLIVDRAEMLRQADRQNIFVISVPMTKEAAGG